MMGKLTVRALAADANALRIAPADTISIQAFDQDAEGNPVTSAGPLVSVFSPRTYFEGPYSVDSETGIPIPFEHEWAPIEFTFEYDNSKPVTPGSMVTATKAQYDAKSG